MSMLIISALMTFCADSVMVLSFSLRVSAGNTFQSLSTWKASENVGLRWLVKVILVSRQPLTGFLNSKI